jgi:hypothetical protein
MEREKMKKEIYKFSARYQDVDLDRIIEENPGADFIVVKWEKNEGHPFGGFVIVTESGCERLRNADMNAPRKYSNARISLSGFGWRHNSFGSGGIRIIDGVDAFEGMLARLRERECRKYKIEVTAIK